MVFRMPQVKNRRKGKFVVLKYGFEVCFSFAAIEGLARISGLPNSAAIIRGMAILWADGTLVQDIEVSVARWLIGWAIGGLMGVALGLLTGRLWAAEIVLEGSLVLLRAIPFISLVPLALRVFGLAETGKIFLIAWASLGITWLVVHRSAQSIPLQVVWRAKSLGVGRRSWIFRVLIPTCLRDIQSGLRAALSLGLIVVAVAELSGVFERSSGYWWSGGIGYRLFRSTDQGRDDLMMASVLTFAILGIVADQVFIGVWNVIRGTAFDLRSRTVARLANHVRDLGRRELEWPVPSMLKVSGLIGSYNSNVVIKGLGFSVLPGLTMSVIGPSGCGKTTLLRAVGHFTDGVFEVAGEVRVDGPLQTGPGTWVGIVLQDAPVFEHMTVWDNVIFGRRCQRQRPEETNRIAWTLLSDFGLNDLAPRRAGRRSGGQTPTT